VNKAIVRVFIVCALLFLALIGNLTYLQVVAAHSLGDKPQNHLAVAQELRVKRGLIRAYDGSVIAGVKQKAGNYYRTYPQGAFAAQLIGYDSARYGRSGLEQSLNDYLTGRASALGVGSILDSLIGRQPKGADVTLTLVPAVQNVAQQELAGKRGAIVVIDPGTGALIASASAPTFSPANLDSQWPKLVNRSDAPLLDRADQGLYPPGSSFKVVTAGAALDAGVATPQSVYTDTGTYVINGGKVVNFGGEIHGQNTLTQALTFSINTTFAKVGVQLGRQRLVAAMQKFGFWQRPPLELPSGQLAVSGRYRGAAQLAPAAPMNPLDVAWASCGQEQVLASPLQMALVAAAVANDGKLMKPYVVQRVTAAGGHVARSAQPAEWMQALTPQAAAQLNKMMQQVVQAGTGTAAALSGIAVAGKTGTAETGRPTNQAWFIAFAPAGAPRVAVAVTVENTSGTGGEVAAPLAAAVLRAALAQSSLP
jgi:peptidoglycan glycosyltransferase